jgi:SNF2 family DNA or RNA helicase
MEIHKGFGYLFEMGCGKTLTAIATAGTAYKLGKVKKVLIVAPTSVCSVWPKEFEEYADFKANVKVMQGDKAHRLKALSDLDSFPFKALKVAVINYESTWREGIFEALYEWDADMIICDESQRIKTHDAEQSKAMHKLGDRARYKLILSGTPVQNNAIDLFSQYRFLDPTVFGVNFYQFRNRYAIMGGFNRRQIVEYKDLDELIQKEHSIAYRVTKKEALDLPEQTFLQRYIQLSTKEKNLYSQLKRDSFAELENGGHITATTVLTKLLRLQQFTGGFLMADGSEKPELVSRGKLDALEDIIDDYVVEAGKKLVVFARFIPEIALIGKLLDKKKIRYGAIYGDVKLEDRGDIVKDFQTNPETKIFLAQIDTAGLGITLTAADTCVYYSVNFNYAAYLQSLARIHRIGQKNTCTYIHLIAEGTIDETILKALARKEDIAKTVVDDWRSYF